MSTGGSFAAWSPGGSLPSLLAIEWPGRLPRPESPPRTPRPHLTLAPLLLLLPQGVFCTVQPFWELIEFLFLHWQDLQASTPLKLFLFKQGVPPDPSHATVAKGSRLRVRLARVSEKMDGKAMTDAVSALLMFVVCAESMHERHIHGLELHFASAAEEGSSHSHSNQAGAGSSSFSSSEARGQATATVAIWYDEALATNPEALDELRDDLASALGTTLGGGGPGGSGGSEGADAWLVDEPFDEGAAGAAAAAAMAPPPPPHGDGAPAGGSAGGAEPPGGAGTTGGAGPPPPPPPLVTRVSHEHPNAQLQRLQAAIQTAAQSPDISQATTPPSLAQGMLSPPRRRHTRIVLHGLKEELLTKRLRQEAQSRRRNTTATAMRGGPTPGTVGSGEGTGTADGDTPAVWDMRRRSASMGETAEGDNLESLCVPHLST